MWWLAVKALADRRRSAGSGSAGSGRPTGNGMDTTLAGPAGLLPLPLPLPSASGSDGPKPLLKSTSLSRLEELDQYLKQCDDQAYIRRYFKVQTPGGGGRGLDCIRKEREGNVRLSRILGRYQSVAAGRTVSQQQCMQWPLLHSSAGGGAKSHLPLHSGRSTHPRTPLHCTQSPS